MSALHTDFPKPLSPTFYIKFHLSRYLINLNAGSGISGPSRFQNYLGEHARRPPLREGLFWLPTLMSSATYFRTYWNPWFNLKLIPMQISIHPPLAEFLEGNSVREAFAADTDSLKHTIAPKLMQDETGLDHSCFLVLVGDNATNKMRTCAVQSVHQTTQWLLNTQWIWFKRNIILSTGFSLRIGVAGEYYIRVKAGLLWKGKAPSGEI